MPRRDREINIFNIAFLDVITGAMGAFILLVLLLAPYYTGPEAPPPQMRKVQKSINRASDSLKQMEKQIDHAIKAGVNPRLLEELKKLLARVKAQLAAAERRMIRLRGEVNRLEEKNQQLHAQLNAAKADIQQLKQEIRRLKAEIKRLNQQISHAEQHQGTAKFRPMVIFVEREHIPNGLLDQGAPFMIYARTIYRAGVRYSARKGSPSLQAQNDPPFSPSRIPIKTFNLSTWAPAHLGQVPFPRGSGVHDEQFFTPQVNNGPGYSTSSPNTEELVIADANLRSHIGVYILLTPPASPSLEKHARFAVTISFGKKSVTRHFMLSYTDPIRKYAIQILPGEQMILSHVPMAATAVAQQWSLRLGG